MRHLGTVIAAAVVGTLSWILFAAGQSRSMRAFENAPDGGAPDGGDFLRPLLVLAAAGILLGLIATLQISPLGATLAGLLYSASYLGLLVNPGMVTALLERTPTLAGYEVDLMAPVRTGTSLLVGSLMLVAVVSARRWQRQPEPATDTITGLATDDIIPPAKDRPLGVDGLGLNPPAETLEPVPASRFGLGRALSGDLADRQGASPWTRQPSR